MIFSRAGGRFNPLSSGLLTAGGLLSYNALLALEPSLLALVSYAGHDMMTDMMTEMRMDMAAAGGGEAMPLSPFNILFVANVIAAAAGLAVLWPAGQLKNISRVPWRQWGWLTAGTLTTSVICASLFTWALFLVPVINVVLIAALKVPLGGLAAWLVFGERPSRRQAWAYALIFIAAAAPLLLDGGLSPASLLEKGDLIALAAILTQVGGQFLTKQAAEMPAGIAVLASNVLAALILFFLAGAFFHPAHILDAFDPRALYLILLYGLLVINGKRLVKFFSFRRASRLAIVSANAFQPVMAMTIAAILTRHPPTAAHMIGGALVLAGILAAYDIRGASAKKAAHSSSRPAPAQSQARAAPKPRARSAQTDPKTPDRKYALRES